MGNNMGNNNSGLSTCCNADIMATNMKAFCCKCLEECGNGGYQCAPKYDNLGMLSEGLKAVSMVLEEGEKTHPHDEWKTGDVQNCISNHLAHAETHLRGFFLQRTVKYSAGVKYKRITKYQREDISHAATRCLMALQLFEKLFDKNVEK